MKRIYRFLINTLPRPVLIRMSYVFRIFAPLIYAGHKVSCSVCGKSFRKFLNYGSNAASRDNVLCPYCLSLERHRLLWLYLKGKTDFFSAPHKVLHIAPEQCFYSRFKKLKNLDYLTGDLLSPLADIKFDLHQIPFEDNTYDIVICNHVLEHVTDSHQCMKELCRVLKPGGMAILQVPIDNTRKESYEDASITDPDEREKHFWQKDHLRLFGLDYPDKLTNAGFTVTPMSSTDIVNDDVEKYRLQKDEILYVATK